MLIVSICFRLIMHTVQFSIYGTIEDCYISDIPESGIGVAPRCAGSLRNVGNHCRYLTKLGCLPLAERWRTSTREPEACRRRNWSIRSDQGTAAASRRSRSSSVVDWSRRDRLVSSSRTTDDQTDSGRRCFSTCPLTWLTAASRLLQSVSVLSTASLLRWTRQTSTDGTRRKLLLLLLLLRIFCRAQKQNKIRQMCQVSN